MAAATIVFYALFTVSDYAQLRFDAPLLYLTTFPVVPSASCATCRSWSCTAATVRPTDIALRDRVLQLIVVAWIGLFFVFVYAMKTIVTGAGGWLGRSLARALAADGRTVRCLARTDLEAAELEVIGRSIEAVVGDVARSAVRRARCSTARAARR